MNNTLAKLIVDGRDLIGGPVRYSLLRGMSSESSCMSLSSNKSVMPLDMNETHLLGDVGDFS